MIMPGDGLITPEVGRQVVCFVAGVEAAPAQGLGLHHAELRGMEVEPSLLSLVCRELNNQRLAASSARISSDLLAGNRVRILRDFYERCVADQPAEVRAFVENQLVTESGVRENVALESAEQSGLLWRVSFGPGRSCGARLLHVEDRLNIKRVELTHDVLTPVVKQSREERLTRERSELRRFLSRRPSRALQK